MLANNSPPHRTSRRQIVHGRAVRELTGENHSGMASAIVEFRAALYPVLGIDTNHKACLIGDRFILTIDSTFEDEIARNLQMKEMSVINHRAGECFPPEICLRSCSHTQLVRRNGSRCWLVEPLHAAKHFASGKRRCLSKRGKLQNCSSQQRSSSGG